MITLCDGPDLPVTPATRGMVYLPLIMTAPDNPADRFVELLRAHPQQRRTSMTVCPALVAAATWKATDIATHDYWSHRASNGEMPNATARRHGCNLPASYADDGNQIECLVAGSADPVVMLGALLNSPKHRTHLLAEADFYLDQTAVGVACVEGGRYGWVWAVYIAPCG